MMLQLADDRPPLPPADLILRVASSFDANDIERNLRSFDLDAFTHLGCLERALAVVGRSLTDFDRLLDFGCGCGRFLRHLGPIADQVEIHGTDIDAEMIEWVRANLPYGYYEIAPHEPPTPYPEHYFDLVINHSVFTHLDERLQDLWLGELQRITRPGAFLLLSIEGQSSWNRTCEASERVGDDPERWRAELESRGILFITDDHFVGSTHPDFYHSTVHAPWYIFEHWTRFFDLAAYIPDGSWTQDLLVMRRRVDGAAQPRPIGRRMSSDVSTRAAPAQPGPYGVDRALAAGAAAIKRLPSRRRAAQIVTPDDEPQGRPDADAFDREIKMLRAGLYEQGKRVSVLARELRQEIDSVRRANSDG